jgi:DNA-binding SARP family transcriptional activator
MSLELGPRVARHGPAGPGRDPRVRLLLLDGFSLTNAGETIDLPAGVQRLIAFLGVQSRPLLRTYMAGTLWPEATEEHAGGNLRSALWRIHQVDLDFIETSRSYIRLSSDVDIDLHEMSAQARRLMDPSVECQEADLEQGPLLGELLSGWYDDWVLLERERARNLRLHGLEALCGRLTRLSRFGPAIEAGLAAVAGEPLRESAHRTLIQAHLAEGNVAEAIRQYAEFRKLVRDELGVDPSSQMEELIPPLLLR